MRFLKSSLSSFPAEDGSAVVEFLILVLPATIAIFSLQGFFGFALSTQVLQQQSYEVARFAALADVTELEIAEYEADFAPGIAISRVSDDRGCLITARQNLSYKIFAWPWPIEFAATGQATCER